MSVADPLILQVDSTLAAALVAGFVGIVVCIIGTIVSPILLARLQNRRQQDSETRIKQDLTEKLKPVTTNIDETKFAVTNEHRSHIRDDIDGMVSKLDELVEAKEQQSSQIRAIFAQIGNQRAREKRRDRALASVAKAVIGVRTDVAALYDRDTSELEEVPELEDAIQELEKTTPRSTLTQARGEGLGFADEETP